MIAFAQIVTVDLEGDWLIGRDGQGSQVVAMDYMVTPGGTAVGGKELARGGEGGERA
jgi:hypothetical protein